MPNSSCRLETDRLAIDPYSDAYVTPDYVGWLNDPEVMHYSENRYRRFTLEDCRDYAASFEGSPHYLWAIVRKDTKRHIGNINAYVDAPNKLADVGILIGARASWGAGYGLEAWKTVCAWLLQDAGMRKVTAGTLDTNIGMKRIMEKSGMIADGRRVRHYLNKGTEVDILYAALFAAPSQASTPRE